MGGDTIVRVKKKKEILSIRKTRIHSIQSASAAENQDAAGTPDNEPYNHDTSTGDYFLILVLSPVTLQIQLYLDKRTSGPIILYILVIRYNTNQDWQGDYNMKYSKNYSVFLIILAMLVCLYSTGYADIMLDAYHFPDTTFRSFIRQQGFDKNGDGILSDTELAKVKIIEYNGHGDDVDKCKSLQGIEFFPNLEELTVASAPVEELNVQQNKKLKIL